MSVGFRKGQVTVFAIVGVILLVVFFIILALVKKSAPEPFDVDKVVDELKAGSVKNHVTSCMNQALMDGIAKLSANGGFIYSSEGGAIPLNSSGLGGDYLVLGSSATGTSHNVAFGLVGNSLCNPAGNQYSYPAVSFANLQSKYDSDCGFKSVFAAYDGFFGRVSLPKLCYSSKESGCEGFAKALINETGFSIQRQLEVYVEDKLPLCVNFSAFVERSNVNISAESPPKVEVDIHDFDIEMRVVYPVKISYENVKPTVEVFDYQSSLNVRLGAVYNFLFSILSKDAKVPSFDLTRDFIESNYWKQGMELKRIKDACPTCPYPSSYDDIIEITDRKSLVDGRPLVFRTAIKNRKPVLDLISDQQILLSNSYVVDIPVVAFDPDDGPVRLVFYSTTIGREHSAPRASSQLELNPGWRENDATLLYGLSNLQHLKFALTRADTTDPPGGRGINPVVSDSFRQAGILAIDDSGLFDNEIFKFRIQDSSTASPFPSSKSCVDSCKASACSDTNLNLGSGCSAFVDGFCENEWCAVASNQCRVVCPIGGAWYKGGGAESGGGGGGSENQACFQCVYSIVFASQVQKHKDCAGSGGSEPDCFKVKFFKSGRFVEEYVNDFDLPGLASISRVEMPAFITLYPWIL